MKVGLVGSTGLVGGTFLKILQERNFPITEFIPFASEASLGKTVKLNDKDYPIQTLNEEALASLELLFIATGEDVSEHWSPIAVEQGCYVIDNSSAFRMHPEVPLVAPEVNGELVNKDQKLYANPNCSTIQLVVMLSALKKINALMTDVSVASYQAVSGAGRDALQELKEQSLNKNVEPKAFPKQIAYNAIPQIGGFDEFGFTSEENKIMKETKKILEMPKLCVSAQTVRIPVINGHAETVWVSFDKEVSHDEVMEALAAQEGLITSQSGYNTPAEISGQDAVYVSRVRQDLDNKNRWLFWVVADNIRKGAATNAVQIAEKLMK